MSNGYQLNEKDIDIVLNYLKIHDPENATPEMAIAILEHFQTKFYIPTHEDPEKPKKLLEELRERMKLKSNQLGY